MLGINSSPEKKLKLVDVKFKGDSFQISCVDKNSKWTLRKSIDDILNFHHSIHESFNESCILCDKLTDISSISSAKFKSSQILKFLNFCIDEQTMEYEEFLYPSKCNTTSSISLKTYRSSPDDYLLQPVKSNSLLSVSVSTPKPKYSDELVDELHRIRNQLALNDSIKENGLFMEVKVKHSNYNFVTILSKDSTFEDFIRKIKRKMAVSQDGSLKFTYKDEDNDDVIIEDEGDFRIALKNLKKADMQIHAILKMNHVRSAKKFKSSNSNDKKSKVPCKYWLEGNCGKGNECLFSHDSQPKTQTTEICKFFLTGSCLKGKKCPFSHDTSLVPCKFYHTKGFCTMGNACKYSHNPIDKETQDKIRKEYGEYQKYERRTPKSLPNLAIGNIAVGSNETKLNEQSEQKPELKLKIYQLPPIFENVSKEEQNWIEEAIKKYKPYTSPF